MFPFRDPAGWENPVIRREQREEMLNKLADLEHERIQILKDEEILKRRMKYQRSQSLPPLKASSVSSFSPSASSSSSSSGKQERYRERVKSTEKEDREFAMEDAYEPRGSNVSDFAGHRGNAGLIFETRYSFNAPGLDVTDLYPHLKEQAAAAAATAAAAAAAAAAAKSNESTSSATSSSALKESVTTVAASVTATSSSSSSSPERK